MARHLLNSEIHICGDPGELPRHTVSVNRDHLPEGVNVSELTRWPDQSTEIEGNEEQIEAMLYEAAQIGQAVDVARFTGDTPDYPHYLMKPNKWLPAALHRPA